MDATGTDTPPRIAPRQSWPRRKDADVQVVRVFVTRLRQKLGGGTNNAAYTFTWASRQVEVARVVVAVSGSPLPFLGEQAEGVEHRPGVRPTGA